MSSLPLPSWEVIEEGRSYLQAASLIVKHGDVGQWRPACVLAGFSIELFLKSFLAKDDSKPLDIKFPNGLTMYQGGVKSARGHELDDLFKKIPIGYKNIILEASKEISPDFEFEQELQKFSGYFFDGRYGYENKAIGVLDMYVLEVAKHLEQVCIQVAPKATQMP